MHYYMQQNSSLFIVLRVGCMTEYFWLETRVTLVRALSSPEVPHISGPAGAVATPLG
jgi:hypothetical protein